MRSDLADIHHWTKADEEDIASLQAQHLESERHNTDQAQCSDKSLEVNRERAVSILKLLGRWKCVFRVFTQFSEENAQRQRGRQPEGRLATTF